MSKNATAPRFHVLEDEANKYVKKASILEKAAVFGELQNRNVARDVHKELKLQDVKPRIDTRWKKTQGDAAIEKSKPLTRVPSLRRPANLQVKTKVVTSVRPVAVQGNVAVKAVDADNKTKILQPKQDNEKVGAKILNKCVKPANRNEVLSANTKILKQTAIVKPKSKENDDKTNKNLDVVNVIVSTKIASKKPTRTDTLNLKNEIAHKETANKLTLEKCINTPTEIIDIDAGDSGNLMLLPEYVNDIYEYLYQLEAEQPIHLNHLKSQIEITPRMRSVLIDWINEVHVQFHLAVETFHMTVSIIDRYLQIVNNVKRSNLQLVGVAAMFIAAKYEELFPPSLAEFSYITDDAYDGKQILKMEMEMFKALDFSFSRPLPIHFLRRFSKAGKAEERHHTAAKYFLELVSIQYDMAHYKPSEIAAGSLLLSLNLFSADDNVDNGLNVALWTPTLEHYSHYTTVHLYPLVKKIASVVQNAPRAKLNAVYRKYESSKFQKIAHLIEMCDPRLKSIVDDNTM